MWVEAYTTNSDPAVIAGYYMKAVSDERGCPRVIRVDKGTENSHIRNMQQFLRRNHQDSFAQSKSFMQGSSKSNQRIECWWSILRKHCAQFWMDFFTHLKEEGLFNGDYLDKSLVQFAFLKLIQEELDSIVQEWNNHTISPSRNRLGPFGRPLVMYTMPQLYAVDDYLKPVPQDKIDVCKSECVFKDQYPCDKDMFDLCTIMTTEMQMPVPKSCEKSLQLYTALRTMIMDAID